MKKRLRKKLRLRLLRELRDLVEFFKDGPLIQLLSTPHSDCDCMSCRPWTS